MSRRAALWKLLWPGPSLGIRSRTEGFNTLSPPLFSSSHHKQLIACWFKRFRSIVTEQKRIQIVLKNTGWSVYDRINVFIWGNVKNIAILLSCSVFFFTVVLCNERTVVTAVHKKYRVISLWSDKCFVGEGKLYM